MKSFCGVIHHRQNGQDRKQLIARMTSRLPGEYDFVSDCLAVGDMAFGYKVKKNSGQQIDYAIHGAETSLSAASARLDDSRECARKLGIESERHATMPDHELVLEAFGRRSELLLGTLFGDWCAFDWDATSKQFRLGAEPYGFTNIYYVDKPGFFAFSTSINALLAIDGLDSVVDQTALVRSITQWRIQENATVFKGIRFLPNGHIIVVDNGRSRLDRYWSMEDCIPDNRLGYQEAAEELRRLLFQSVKARVANAGKMATTLSCGLDSTAITGVANTFAAAAGGSIDSYCSVPLFPDDVFVPGDRFSDESELARPYAESLSSVVFHTHDAANMTPLEGLRKTVSSLRQPFYSTSNDHWLHSLFQRAAADGNDTILFGGMGNGTFSWGSPANLSFFDLVKRMKLRAAMRRVKQSHPVYRVRRALIMRETHDFPWENYSPINPDFAREFDLLAKMREEGRDPTLMVEPYGSGLEARLDLLRPGFGKNPMYSMYSQNNGLNVLDPTADTRLILFTLSLPEHIFIGPDSVPRWLARESMKGVLPDSIRLNHRRGYQAADFNAKLRQDGASMDQLLAALSSHPQTTELLDMPRLNAIWHDIKTDSNFDNQWKGWRVLFNGLCAGHFMLEYS